MGFKWKLKERFQKKKNEEKEGKKKFMPNFSIFIYKNSKKFLQKELKKKN